MSWVIAFALGVPFLWALPRWPVGWDATGFVLSAMGEGVDLAQGRPHPPGYPLYAILASLIRALGLTDPSLIAQTFGALNVLALVLLLQAAVRWTLEQTGSLRLSALAGLVVLLGQGWTMLAGQCLPDLLSIALLAQALACVRDRRLDCAAILAGISLANRPSDVASVLLVTPVLAWGFSQSARALLRGTALAALSFVLSFGPLLVHHGALRFWQLCEAHGRAHWSGAFEPAALRAADPMARAALWLDSVSRFWLSEPRSLVSVLACVVTATLAVVGVRAIAPQKTRVAVIVSVILLVIVRYYLQAMTCRHDALWSLAVTALSLFGLHKLVAHWVLTRAWRTDASRRARGALIVCLVGLSLATYALQLQRQRIAREVVPAEIQAAQYVARVQSTGLHSGRVRRGTLAVFGLRSARAAELFGIVHFVSRSTGEMLVTAERMDVLPEFLYFTDELQNRAALPLDRRSEVLRACEPEVLRWRAEPRGSMCVLLFRYRVRDGAVIW